AAAGLMAGVVVGVAGGAAPRKNGSPFSLFGHLLPVVAPVLPGGGVLGGVRPRPPGDAPVAAPRWPPPVGAATGAPSPAAAVAGRPCGVPGRPDCGPSADAGPGGWFLALVVPRHRQH